MSFIQRRTCGSKIVPRDITDEIFELVLAVTRNIIEIRTRILFARKEIIYLLIIDLSTARCFGITFLVSHHILLAVCLYHEDQRL